MGLGVAEGGVVQSWLACSTWWGGMGYSRGRGGAGWDGMGYSRGWGGAGWDGV